MTNAIDRYLQDNTSITDLHPPADATIRPPGPPAPKPKPRLILMGNPGSGKSSISSVVFHKMPPSETLFLESTARINKDSINSFMDFDIWDFPGQIDYFDPSFDYDSIFSEIGALLFIIDAQDEYLEPLMKLKSTILLVQRVNPQINIEVFIHKVDALSEDYKQDTYRDIVQRIHDELADEGLDNSVPLSFHLTSIYDHSIFEAFSKVIQKLIPQLPTLEHLMTLLCTNCQIEKAFLFDVLSKIYIATDSSPVDITSYTICSDSIDLIVDLSEIYGYDRPKVESAEPIIEPEASSSIRIGNGQVIMIREVNKYLALICLLSEKSFKNRPLIDVNVEVFQDALEKVFNLGKGRNILSS